MSVARIPEEGRRSVNGIAGGQESNFVARERERINCPVGAILSQPACSLVAYLGKQLGCRAAAILLLEDRSPTEAFGLLCLGYLLCFVLGPIGACGRVARSA